MDTSTAPTTLEYGKIIIELFGGLALFLYGMDKLTEGLKAAAGNGIKTILAQLTKNRFTGMLAGAAITAIIQSSSVTTVLMVGFISAGLMTAAQSVGVILGANIGTTITAQIIAFKISKYGLLMLASGFLLEIVIKKERFKQYAVVLMSLGFIFFGMQIMSNGTSPLREFAPFIELMCNLQNPLMGILIATIFTAIVQSSSATIGIIIVLANQGFVSLEAGIALVLGSNIGTCITAVLAALGKPREAVKAALIHVIFKVVGVLLWLPFISSFASLVREISPVAEGLTGMARLGIETPRQIANAHTIFNVVNAFLFLGFTNQFIKLVDKIIPSKPVKKKALVEPQFLDPIFISQPELALDSARRELSRLGQSVLQMMQRSYAAITSKNKVLIQKLKAMEGDADKLYVAIVDYLRTLSAEELTERQTRLAYHYLAIANVFERIGDIIENNLLYNAEECMKGNVIVSPGTLDYLDSIHKKLCSTGNFAVDSIESSDEYKAEKALTAKKEFNALLKEARQHLAVRLCQKEPNRLQAYKLETDMIESFKYLHTMYRNIAKLVRNISIMDKKKKTDNDREDWNREFPV
ncbi:MAG: Na/Pi cotransporter family protein [Fibrobacteria bacterium]|nr:Na/Pi cotransporter family protein [Fibrobacteria bacterium]